jgi:hypothetical protein
LAKKLNLEIVLNNMKEKHQNKYTYNLFSWGDGITTTTKFEAICQEHGSFYTTYSDHYRLGSGCSKCKGNKKLTNQEFIDKVKERFPNLDCTKVNYVNNTTKVLLICPIHGDFLQKPHNVLRASHQCPSCAKENGPKQKIKNDYENKKYKLDLYFKNKPNLDSEKTTLIESTKYFSKVEFFCKIHGSFISSLNNIFTHNTNCPNCNKPKAENEISELIPNPILNSRKIINPLEIDIFSNEYKFGIEYNGIVFHSFGLNNSELLNNYHKLDKNKHLIKTLKMEELDYQLFHIKDIDWNNPIKKEIWKSIINNKLGKSNKFFARKFKIIDLTGHKEFVYKYLEDNHLQGNCGYKYAYGLCNKSNEVYSIMTFGKSRFDKNMEYELLRFCNLKNCTIVGGASKLLKYFEKTINPTSIVSYANRDWSQGNLYESLGFEFIKSTSPNYFYTDTNRRIINRMSAQKHKLKNLLNENFNENLSERDNMINNGYRIYYDTGNLVYHKKY